MTGNHLNNIVELVEDMIDKDRIITSFPFKYNGEEYDVMVEHFNNLSQYAKAQLEFLRNGNLNDSLKIEVNVQGLVYNKNNFSKIMNKLKKYFRITGNGQGGFPLTSFLSLLNKHIPLKVSLNPSSREKRVMCSILDKNDSQDPNKIYCMGMFNNAKGKTRTEFNSEKTKLYRPALFDRFKADDTISFRYSANPEDKKTDAEIIRNWTQNNI